MKLENLSAGNPLARARTGVALTELAVGVEKDGQNLYGSGNLLEILPPEILQKVVNAGFDASIMTEVKPEKWLELSRIVNPAEGFAQRFDPTMAGEIAENTIIPQITARARLASMLGASHAVLMSVHPREISKEAAGSVMGMISPERLLGVAKHVWEHLSEKSADPKYAKYQPTLDFWAGLDEGAWSGYNIVMHFPPSTKVQRANPEQLGPWAIQQIPLRATLEALTGRDFAPVFSFRDGDEAHINKDSASYPPGSKPYTVGEVKPYMLQGPAKEVWDYAVANKLSPTLEYWDTVDADGKDVSGFDIVVHWFTKDQATAGEQLAWVAVDQTARDETKA